MKRIFILLIVAFSSLSLNAQTKQPIDKNLNEALEEMSTLLEEIDISKLFDHEFFGQIEKTKPSDKEIDLMKGLLKQNIESMKKIDFSVLEEFMNEMEQAFGDMEFTSPLQKAKPQVKPAEKGRKI